MKNLIKTPNFKAGVQILEKYEDNSAIQNMGDSEWYVGDMNIWEDKISNEEIQELQLLGFHWYKEAECLLFNGSSESIY